jgi:HEPN domain-containing protein
MRPLTREWVQKAEGDFTVAAQIMRRRKRRIFDAACFHSQQTAEKYLKACLYEEGVAFPKTHDLVVLLKLMLPREPLWAALLPAAQPLTAQKCEGNVPGNTPAALEPTFRS